MGAFDDYNKINAITLAGYNPYKGINAAQGSFETPKINETKPVSFGQFTAKHRPVNEQLAEIAPDNAKNNYQNGLAPRDVEKGQSSTVLSAGGKNIQCRDLAYC